MEVCIATTDAVIEALKTCIDNLETKLNMYSSQKIGKALQVLKGSLFDDEEYMAPMREIVHPLRGND
jgi:hypothetical protein